MKPIEPTINTPLFVDFAIVLPDGIEIESGTQIRDCVTWGVSGTDDD